LTDSHKALGEPFYVFSFLLSYSLQVWNLQPWFAKDFAIRSLSDRIKDLAEVGLPHPQFILGSDGADTFSGNFPRVLLN
jgi:hypothetical protein